MVGEANISKIVSLPKPGSAAPKRVSVMGATGSVGLNTLDLLRRNQSAYDIVALTAGRNVAKLAELAREFRPQVAVIASEAAYDELVSALAGTDIEVAAGEAAIVEAAARPCDLLMASIVGAAGLASTFEAARNGTTIGLANKESLVAAGDLLTREVAHGGSTLLPVDSEHSAIFQVFAPEQADAVDCLTLTASGGPFREWPLEKMKSARLHDALAHPNFSMGDKISIDSATMMNKGFELIEAHHLFGIDARRLEVLVHPQQIIHSMVSYKDGSTLAQLGEPDMRTPIAVALAWPDRMDAPIERLDLAQIGSLDFSAPDFERFPALTMARDALTHGGGAPAALNAANEVAVEEFLAERIGYLEIAEIVRRCVEILDKAGELGPHGNLEDVFALDERTRILARDVLSQR